MSNAIRRTPDQAFAARVSRMARQQCERLLGTQEGQQAAQRITMSILGAMQSARDPSAFHTCTDLSLANCIALSAQTRLMPGGPNPTVYLVPQSARRGEPPELQWRITHRGIAVLAYRAGFGIRAVPVQNDEFLRISLGEVVEHVGSAADWPRSLDEIQGIAVVVRDLDRSADVVRAWVPRQVIEARRAKSRMSDRGPWRDWPVEMAQGAAIRYLMSRGQIPLDSPELSVALAEDHADIIDATSTTKSTHSTPAPTTTTGMDALAAHVAPALPDHGEVVDLVAGDTRESVAARHGEE